MYAKTSTKVIAILLIFLFQNFSLQAQDSSAVAKQALISQFETLTVSFSGNAQNCIPYDVYAFKYKRSWMIVMRQESTLALFVTKPPRSTEALYEGSTFLLDGLSRIIPNTAYFKKKNRRRVVNDIEIYPYYKLKKRGKQVMKGLFLLELPEEEKEPFFLLKPFMKKKEEAEEKVPLKRDFEESIQKAKDNAEATVEEAISK